MKILDNSFVFLVDADNLFFGVRNQKPFESDVRLDFKVLKDIALDGRSFGFSYAKVFSSMRSGKPDVFTTMLKRNGFFSHLAMRPLSANASVRDMDVLIAVEAVTYRIDGKFPSIVSVASGDADFMPAYEYLRSEGVRVEVVSFPECISRDVSTAVDRVILLDSRVTFKEAVEVVGG
jgi:uncharacterized LabA/DUF88 family protein